MMKSILVFALTYVAVISSAVAQTTTTYACRYVGSVGFISKDGNWAPTTFELGKPFFLYAHDGTLQHPEKSIPSLEEPWPLLLNCQEPRENYLGWTAKGEAITETFQACGKDVSHLTFNFVTLEGVLTNTYGGIAPRGSKTRQPIYMAPFVCERMPQPHPQSTK